MENKTNLSIEQENIENTTENAKEETSENNTNEEEKTLNKEIHQNIEKTENLLQSLSTDDAIEFSKWTKDKSNLRYNGNMPTFPIYNNFIYWCNLGINIGSEQNKLRPVLIVKTDKNSTVCSIVPLTTQKLHDGYWYHIDLTQIDSTALVEQLRVVSKIRIEKPFRTKGKLTIISQEDWNKINQQLESLYRLKPLKTINKKTLQK